MRWVKKKKILYQQRMLESEVKGYGSLWSGKRITGREKLRPIHINLFDCNCLIFFLLVRIFIHKVILNSYLQQISWVFPENILPKQNGLHNNRTYGLYWQRSRRWHWRFNSSRVKNLKISACNEIFSNEFSYLKKKEEGNKQERKNERVKKGKKPSVYLSMVKDSPVDMTPKSLLYWSKGQA